MCVLRSVGHVRCGSGRRVVGRVRCESGRRGVVGQEKSGGGRVRGEG